MTGSRLLLDFIGVECLKSRRLGIYKGSTSEKARWGQSKLLPPAFVILFQTVSILTYKHPRTNESCAPVHFPHQDVHGHARVKIDQDPWFMTGLWSCSKCFSDTLATGGIFSPWSPSPHTQPWGFTSLGYCFLRELRFQSFRLQISAETLQTEKAVDYSQQPWYPGS